VAASGPGIKPFGVFLALISVMMVTAGDDRDRLRLAAVFDLLRHL
jgi:hypothetical protein